MTRSPRFFGIAGWKNSGKTGLAVRLVEEFTRRGYKISTIKHAHHDFDIDKVGADSYRHRGLALMRSSSSPGRAMPLCTNCAAHPNRVSRKSSPHRPCDLVLIEGYKREPVPKIEARREAARNENHSPPPIRSFARSPPTSGHRHGSSGL